MLQDIETFDLEDFKYNSVNITAFRLVDVGDTKVSEILQEMEQFQPIGNAILNRSGIIQVRYNIIIIFNARFLGASSYTPNFSDPKFYGFNGFSILIRFYI